MKEEDKNYFSGLIRVSRLRT